MRNRSIVIELTALLDVILIIVFMVLIQSAQKVEAANTSASEVEAQIQDLREENDRLNRWMDGIAVAEDNSQVVNLCVSEKEGQRAVLVECEGKELASIPLAWDNRTFATNALNLALENSIAETEAQVVFLVFEYNRNQIYQSDYALITSAIQAQKHNSHVYTAEYDIATEERIVTNELTLQR